MRTFIENYLHFMKNCIRPHYEKLKPLKSGFIENSNFENNRDPCKRRSLMEAFTRQLTSVARISGWRRSPAGAIREIRRIQYSRGQEVEHGNSKIRELRYVGEDGGRGQLIAFVGEIGQK